jgi:hypothetical protein
MQGATRGTHARIDRQRLLAAKARQGTTTERRIREDSSAKKSNSIRT